MASQLNHPGIRQTIGLVSEGSTCGRGRLTTLDMITTVLNPTTNDVFFTCMLPGIFNVLELRWFILWYSLCDLY